MSENAFFRFRAAAAVMLGALTGSLIVLPLIAGNPEHTGAGALAYLGAGALFGALTGYRRRGSTMFLYFCVVCILALSSVIMFTQPQPGAKEAANTGP